MRCCDVYNVPPLNVGNWSTRVIMERGSSDPGDIASSPESPGALKEEDCLKVWIGGKCQLCLVSNLPYELMASARAQNCGRGGVPQHSFDFHQKT